MNQYHNAKELTYEEMTFFNQPVLFTPARIDKESIPKGMHRYEVREESGDICQIGLGVLINHWGTILSNKKISLERDGYRYVDKDSDVKYIGDCKTIEDYTKKYPIKNKQQER